MSPRKTVANADKPSSDDLKKPSQPKFGAAKDRTTARRSRLSAVPPPQEEPEFQVASIELPSIQQPATAPHEPALNTPAASDIFSPTPEYSTGPTNRSGTPPPTGLTSATVEAARPSRRARSAVNYAEPSLGAKMRRQEKGMMDAVTGLQHHRRAMSGSGERKSRGSVVVVKGEPQDEDAWKNLPAAGEAALSAAAQARAVSPLQSKGGSVDAMMDSMAPSKTMANGSIVPPGEAKPSLPAAVQGGSRQRVRSSTSAQDREMEKDNGSASNDLDVAAQKLRELDLYDFKDFSSSSSPADQQQQQQSHNPSSAAAKPSATAPSRTHRRHSSIPKDSMKSSAAVSATTAGDNAERVKSSSSSGRTSTATSASRRRSMMT